MKIVKYAVVCIFVGSVLPLDLLLRLMGRDYDKRNCTFGVEANTLLHLSCSGNSELYVNCVLQIALS